MCFWPLVAIFALNMQPLIDISALSACFKEYGPHPLHYVYRLLQPVTPSAYNLLGNAVNNMFDAVVSSKEPLQEILQKSWHDDALLYLDVDEDQLRKVYFNTVKDQYDHIRKVVEHEFPLQGINAEEAWLEPSFVCPELGLSGRMDLLEVRSEELGVRSAKIVELKSGKMNEWQGHAKQAHRVQTMLYAEVLHRCLGIDKEHIKSFLHYNTYPLLEHQIFPEELCESALSLRDEILQILHEIAMGKGRKYFTRQAVENMYPHEFGKLWCNYDKPQLLSFVEAIEDAAPALQDWFFEKLQFILHEEELKETQPEAVSLRGLPLIELGIDEKDEIKTFVLSISEAHEHDFRPGDPVILYPMDTNETTKANAIVLRGSIESLSDVQISVSLRHAERLCHFSSLLDNHQPFALEHDTINSSISQACRSIYSTLLQGGPEIDNCRLIVGPPGTGKTSVTLRNMVHDLYHNTQERVLLLAFTHRAVDEICETLESECPYVRLGTMTDTPEAFRPRLLQPIIDACSNRTLLRQRIGEQRFWTGTTARLLAMPHLFDLLEFDTIIVDEASQLLDHQVIELLKHARKEAILIGDPKQLPAVTLQEGAQSLFEQLYRKYQQEGHQGRITLLNKQGRMHPAIADFSNSMFYGNLLSPVGLPHQQETTSLMPRYAFIDVPSAPLGTKSNPAEASMVARLVNRIAEIYQKEGLEWTEKTLGIIVPYRQQIAAIRTELANKSIDPSAKASSSRQEHRNALSNGCEDLTPHSTFINIDTVERYQGSQRDIIIYTTTVSTSDQLSMLSTPMKLDGQLIDRKLNVAITRARKHLYIVGNRQLLSQSPVYAQLIEMMQ